MLAVIAVVVTLVIVLPTGDGGTSDPIISTTEGTSVPSIITTPSTSTTPEVTIPTEATTEGPTTTTEEPTTEEPTTEEPTTEDPTTEEPTTEEPTTEEPTTEEPTTDAVTVPPETIIDLEDIIGDTYSPPSFDATWADGSDVVIRNENGDLVLFDVETNTTKLLLSNSSDILQRSSRSVLLAPNEEEVALSYDVVPLYRHSFLAQYAVVNITTGNTVQILPPGVTRNTDGLLQNFVWGPSGTSLAFVYLNNIYYQANLSVDPVPITTTGQVNVIYHGIPDWVYEEEVFSSNNALWFSADGTKIAYASFNDTDVRVMRVPHYGVPGSVLYQYTQHHEIRYPKSGTTNPIASVTIVDLETGEDTTFEGPEDLNEPILKPVHFVSNDVIALMWTNRAQTTFVVDLCTHLGNCSRIFTYTETNGWIDNIPLIFNEQGNAFITILPFAVDGVRYKQVVQVSEGAAGELWTLQNRVNTAHTVTGILRWTSDNSIWYKATHVDDSAEQHIYKVETAGALSCFTCAVRECGYNDGDLNRAGDLLTVNCLGPNIPQVFIYNTSGDLIRVWADNTQLTEVVSPLVLPATIRLSVPSPEGLPEIDVLIQAPPDYATRTNVPLLVYVYGGPDTALVTAEWLLDWGTSLVSRFGVAVARLDGRGSGLKGVDNMFALNRRLGSVEVEDQIYATRYLHDTLPWLDRNHSCIWGWSYGGYAASLALARGGGVFRCAAAVAPVVDWRFYDTIYTERYMDTPANNTEGYLESSLLTDDVAEALRDKHYFLIHGTADDNVHYQHAMLISRLLQRRDVYFTQMSYTDEDHGLVGVRPHLYHALEKFLSEHLW
ncbi:venom dipeptidyl peptidase 4-like isoform X2 [Plodia interpunctella]|nr:venom dipeptidyl peptidase 4-like isoform X2 [Plodia interpunctella]